MFISAHRISRRAYRLWKLQGGGLFKPSLWKEAQRELEAEAKKRAPRRPTAQ